LNWKQITLYFIAITAAVIAGYDIFVMQVGGKEASISQQLILISYEYPIVTFLLGVICGHLFWRMKSNPGFKHIDKVENDN
jgi:hypothetical protein